MDLDNAYVPFLPGIGNEVGFSDPAFQAKHKKDSGNEIDDDITAGSMVWENTIFTGAAHTWDELDFLKRNWDGPIVLKGWDVSSWSNYMLILQAFNLSKMRRKQSHRVHRVSSC